MINLTINGKSYNISQEQVENRTLWQFLKDNGYYVPILCNYENLKPVGRCRLCVVKDRGRIKTSCIAPLENGMEIITDDPDLRKYRKWALQFLFSERNHYCMYCAITSHCEFQNLGYYTKLDHFSFPTFFNKYELDNSHNHILFDNNRCVLCDRCVRVCSEIAGHFVLETINKGIERLVVADGGKKLGESSCVSCGLCVQVCPTGTLLDKYSLYLDKNSIDFNSYCYLCPVGCGIKIYINKNKDYIVKIHSDFNSFSNGLICYKIRYQELLNYRLFKAQQYQQNNKLNEYYLDNNNLKDFLYSIITNLKDFLVILDGTLLNQELKLINDIFKNNVYTYYPITKDILNNPDFKEIEEFQNYIIINVDLDKDYGAIGSLIKRNVKLKNKNLITLNLNNPNYTNLSKLNINNINDLKKLNDTLYDNFLFILNAIDYIQLKDDIKDLLTNKNYRFLILPIKTNDVGIIYFINNLNTINLSLKINDNKTIIIFSRDLKNIKEINLFKIIQNNSKIIFTLKDYENLEILNNLKNIKLLVYLPHLLNFSGNFYNMFNMLLKTENIFKELSLKDK